MVSGLKTLHIHIYIYLYIYIHPLVKHNQILVFCHRQQTKTTKRLPMLWFPAKDGNTFVVMATFPVSICVFLFVCVHASAVFLANGRHSLSSVDVWHYDTHTPISKTKALWEGSWWRVYVFDSKMLKSSVCVGKNVEVVSTAFLKQNGPFNTFNDKISHMKTKPL